MAVEYLDHRRKCSLDGGQQMLYTFGWFDWFYYLKLKTFEIFYFIVSVGYFRMKALIRIAFVVVEFVGNRYLRIETTCQNDFEEIYFP